MSTEPAVTKPAAKSNPLTKFFRTPAIYVTLPSAGKHWPADSIDMPENMELPVFPMTNRDEITLRTPDALINGQGVVDVIQSCVPAIKDAWQTPSVDIDTLLMAVRIASYGHNMDLEQTCTACQHEDTYSLDLRIAMSGIRSPDYSTVEQFEQLRIRFKPQNYKGVNAMNQLAFELTKTQQNLDNLESSEEKDAGKTMLLDRYVQLNVDTLVAVTDYIELVDSEQQITDTDHIKEFYSNINSAFFDKIQSKILALGRSTEAAPHMTACTACGAEITLNILFDYSSFFVTGS